MLYQISLLNKHPVLDPLCLYMMMKCVVFLSGDESCRNTRVMNSMNHDDGTIVG